MKTKHFILTGLIFALAVLISSQVSARMWGQNHGSMMGGSGMMHDNAQTLTEDQQDTVKEIEERYQPQLAEKETAVRNKAEKLQAAKAKDSTTIGELDNLRNELYDLKQDYWSLRDKVNQEISSNIGISYDGNMGRGSGYCDYHNDHLDMHGNTTSRMCCQRGSMRGHGRGGRCR